MKSKTFIEAYRTLETSNIKTIREKIMRECGWNSRTTFYDKAKGIVPLRLPEEKIIKQIFLKENIDAFTGQPIRKRAASS